MKNINWNTEKSLAFKESRGICFEDLVFHFEKGDILDDYQHPNQHKYAVQRIMVVGTYVEDKDELFLKTIIQNRKAAERYFGEKHEDQINKRRKRNGREP